MERIEEGVIILHALHQHGEQIRAGIAKPDLRAACQRSLVSFHFQLLVLQNYVALNFTAITKVLKKFEKKFEILIKDEYIGAIVELPFYRCDALGARASERGVEWSRKSEHRRRLDRRRASMTSALSRASVPVACARCTRRPGRGDGAAIQDARRPQAGCRLRRGRSSSTAAAAAATAAAGPAGAAGDDGAGTAAAAGAGCAQSAEPADAAAAANIAQGDPGRDPGRRSAAASRGDGPSGEREEPRSSAACDRREQPDGLLLG